MEFTAEDFANRLAGGMDKHEAVKKIKEIHNKEGIGISIQRRNLAGGKKIYFVITLPDNYTGLGFSLPSIKHFSKETIKEYFPESRLTSGGGSSWTIAEY